MTRKRQARYAFNPAPSLVEQFDILTARGSAQLFIHICQTRFATAPRIRTADWRTWGLMLRERIGFKRAAVAVARKLTVIMHAMLKTGKFFDPNAGAAA
jgi:hypothetical protein